jgi:hypothetical protein
MERRSSSLYSNLPKMTSYEARGLKEQEVRQEDASVEGNQRGFRKGQINLTPLAVRQTR